MKNMITAMLVIIGSGIASAQMPTVTTKPDEWNVCRIGIEAGAGMNSISSSNVSQPIQLNESAGMYISYMQAGILLESGLKWNRRNFNFTGFIPEYTSNIKRLNISANYIEVPLNFGYFVNLADFKNRNVMLGFKLGMYFACGLNGSGNVYATKADGTMFENKIDNSFNNQKLESGVYNKLNRFDMGGKFGIDVYISHFKYSFSYTRGWIDINKTLDRHMKTKSFDFTIGYSFYLKQTSSHQNSKKK